MRSRLLLFVLLVLLMPGRLLAQTQTLGADPWQQLQQKQAWILLGFVEQYKDWATAQTFEIVGRERRRGAFTQKFKIPPIGSRIRVTGKSSLVIVGYRSTGEKWALVPPPLAYPLQDSDHPGLNLPAGAEVVVKMVVLVSGEGMAHVWAMVSPP